MKFLVLSNNTHVIESIKRYLKFVYSVSEIHYFQITYREDKIYENFLIIKDWIESLYTDDLTVMKETLAFFDPSIGNLSDLKLTGAAEGDLASLLFVSFPEIYWFFLSPFGTEGTENLPPNIMNQDAFQKFHSTGEKNKYQLEAAIKHFLHGYTPLFDPTGIRQAIIMNTLNNMEQDDGFDIHSRPFFNKRIKKALIIDEEIRYTYLHSYVAYKFNHRSMAVSTKYLLEELRGIFENTYFDLSFEDICISFPDEALRYNKMHSLEERDSNFDFVKNIKKRIFVTIGEAKSLKKENRAYRKRWKRMEGFRFYRILFKPYAGIFNLMKEARLHTPSRNNKEDEAEGTGNHSQPGRLGAIAGILINRSARILSEVKSSNDAIHAAMLALQAQEILGGRTATESIQALSLKHQAEVMAECMFYGVEHNFEVKQRFQEIEEELDVIGKWFNKPKRALMKYNSALNIVNQLARIFRNYSQFDEEQKCLNKVRSYNRKINRKRSKIFGWIVSPIRWYFELLVGSLGRFLATITFWPLFFTIVYNLSGLKFKDALLHSINSFFALQITYTGPNELNPPVILSTILIILGFFHLGIFISHLYTIVSRR